MSKPLGLFEGFGIELEYMIVDQSTLAVRPVADELLRAVGGDDETEVELGDIAWSNELALHVIEMKSNGPVPELGGLAARFQNHVGQMNAILDPLGARLLPSAMHPFMDPERDLRLWPHENDVIYAAFDRIFGCRGHGWANLQSMHINLPFAGDEQFARLHAAIRLVLPLIPALAASSPFIDGLASEFADTRLETYRTNARRVPSVSGQVIPEAVFSRADYEGRLLAGIYRDLEPFDPEGVLRHEWVNSRGAIARFERMAIEIRTIDLQECPSCDLAVAAAVVSVVRRLVGETSCDLDAQKNWNESDLAAVHQDVVRDADEAMIVDLRYLNDVGYPDCRQPARAGDVWHYLIESSMSEDSDWEEWRGALNVILEQGPLSRRLRKAVGPQVSMPGLHEVYGELADCLTAGRPFQP
jgi:carboxylate-amine ligase